MTKLDVTTTASPTAPGVWEVDSPPAQRARRWPRIRTVPVGYTLALAVVAVMALAVAAPQLFTDLDPNKVDPIAALLPPSSTNVLGTDSLGRDVFTRIVYGARFSLFIGVASTAFAAFFGLLLGLLAGISNRIGDEVISRFFDTLGAFPEILLALLLIAFAGPGMVNVIFAIGIASITRYARVVRGQTISIRNSAFVEQARTLGLSEWRLTLRHIVPNVISPLPVLVTLGLGSSILGAASLSFVGLGPQPPTAEWGAMLSQARDVLRVAPWAGLYPGVAIVIAVVAFTVIGKRWQKRFEGRI